MKSREIAFRTIEILLPILTVYFVVRYLGHDHAFIIEVIVIPMQVILLCELLHAKYVTAPEQQDQTRDELELVRLQLGKVTEYLLSGEIASYLLIIKALGRATVPISAAEMDDVWNQLTWSVNKSYFTANYVNYVQMYGNERAKAIIATQRAKILAGGVTITKVFIVEDENEISSAEAKETLALHRAEGINDLFYIKRSDIRARLGEKLTVTDENVDFGIFDESVVLCWDYDRKRKIKGGKLLFGEKEVQPYREFAMHLKSVSRKCP